MAFYTQFIFNCFFLLTVFLVATYGYFRYAYTYWERRKFPFIPPKFPYGNSPWLITKTSSYGMETVKFYQDAKKRGYKFAGVYTITRPVLILTEPDYIRDILSKDFQYFVNRGLYYNEKDDPISAHLFAINEEKWRNIRTKLTPTFSSGKMKMMFETIVNVSEYLTETIGNCAEEHKDIDIREFLAKFTTDVIGTCAFGIDCNSFKDPKSEFRKYGDYIFTNHGIVHLIRLVFVGNFPDLALKFGVKRFSPEVSNFFRQIVKQTVAYREQNNIYRPDFLQLLIELKKNTEDSSNPLTMDQLTSNVFLFFIAGFDTSSTTMNFALYELCKHPDIQEKVRREINEVLGKYNGKITYESLGEMNYMSQVIDEAQRIYAPLVNLTRVCTKDYKLRNTDLIVEKGTSVVIPVMAIHRDPNYYPNPEKFDPERFNSENKASRHPYLHLPFGEGPRNCIGMRFGMMQTKIGLIAILRRFRLNISPSTSMPLELDPRFLLLKSRNTLYLTAEKL